MNLSDAFTAQSSRLLTEVYLPRLQRALTRLPADDLWWRPRDESLCFGTILLHLEGNVRQWILSGIGGAEDRRDRDAEFAATDGPGGDVLLSRLEETTRAAAAIISALDRERLESTATIQGGEQELSWAVYHVVEHFGYHTGQAVWIAKARAATGSGRER